MVKNNFWMVCLICVSFVACNGGADHPDTVASNDTVSASTDPLPSWNEGDAKNVIISYVTDITKTGGPDFIPAEDRIATFDNDGTLWSEQPVYFQLFFALDQVRAMASQHPEWKTKQPYKAVLENNMDELMKQGEKGLLKIIAVSHAGFTTDQFEENVSKWIDTAMHPTKHKLYKELVFQPMLELVKYLQEHDVKVFIVSGGGIEFMRAWAEKVYGIPKNQIVGSSLKESYDYNNGDPIITKLPELEFNDDKEGKPAGIQKFIGRKPVVAVGNSDGDLQMLQWASSNKLKNLEIYIHHTDSVREWAYDRTSHIGTFNKGFDEALEKKWLIVDMKNDWKVIYPFEK